MNITTETKPAFYSLGMLLVNQYPSKEFVLAHQQHPLAPPRILVVLNNS